ncbi:cytochrome P450 20A1-like protein, partial [Dinothrombium tinctorium]
GSKKVTSIPGEDPADPREGNLLDIIKCRGFGNFLTQLHSKYGEVASFWLFGPSLAISIASPKTIARLSHLFDKPNELYTPLEPFIGKSSILTLNNSDARKRRALWNQMLSDENFAKVESRFEKLLLELIEKWADLPSDEHIPVVQFMKAFVVKASLILGFGDYFRQNAKSIVEFGRTLEVCWIELENRCANLVPVESGVRESNFMKNCNTLRDDLTKAVRYHQDVAGNYALLEPLILAKDLNEEEILDDCMTYILKMYSLIAALSWILYELALRQEQQREIARNRQLIDKFIYETLCNHVVEMWTARVNNHVDEDIEGNIVPKATPLVFALNVALQNSENENTDLIFGCKESKRYCPANNFSMKIVHSVVNYLVNNFTLHLVSEDLIPETVNTIIGRSEDEMWIT